jgi:hypothetical protein
MPPAEQTGRQPDPAIRQRWQQRLQRIQRSGLTVTAFCAREGVSTASFYTWRRRLQREPDPPVTDKPRIVPVRLVAPATAPLVELLLPSGCVLRLPPECDLAWLRQLLPMLGIAPC